MAEIGDGIVVARWIIAVAHTDLEYEDIASGPAGERIVATVTDQHVVAIKAFQRVVATVAGDDVVELGATHCVDTADECVVTNRGVTIGSSRAISDERNHDAGGRMIERNARIAIAGDLIVAAAAFELVEGGSVAINASTSSVRARCGEARSVIAVRKI